VAAVDWTLDQRQTRSAPSPQGGRELTASAAQAPADLTTTDATTRPTLLVRHQKLLLGCLSVAIFFVLWEAIFLVVPLNTLFISKPSLIALALIDLIATGDLAHDLAVSAVPFLLGFAAAVVIGVAIGILMGWRARVSHALDPLMTVFYASPLVALAPLVVVLFGVGVAGKAILIFLLSVFPFIFNAAAGVRAVDPLLISVVRSLGGSEKDLYLKVIVPSVLPYIIAGARIAIGRALIGVLVAEFFAASEGIGYAIARFGDLFALDRMFASILVIMIIAVLFTEGLRWAERTAFPWRVGQ
jgi:ABC-type nitrate/sulfonate/bicarbonate transport system permease component